MAHIVPEPVSSFEKWGEDSWLCPTPRIPGAFRGSCHGKCGGCALARHLNTRAQISHLPLPAWATLAEWLTPLSLCFLT